MGAGRHRKRRDKRRPDRSQRGRPALRSVAPSITAAVALAGASVVAVDPAASALPKHATTSADVRLAADSSVLNIPINLVQDIVNIPYNEVQTINYLGDNLLFTGTWNIASSTSVWGTDPGDMGRYGVVGLFIPFPAFSDAAAAQLLGVAEVLLPVNPGCGTTCDDLPSLVGGWFQADRIMELLTTGQYTFDDTPVTEPDGTTHPPQGLWSYAGPVTWGADFNHPEWNTKIDPATGEPVMPWAGTTFKLDPLSPVTNYLAHLMSDPTSDENTAKFPTVGEFAAAVQKLATGVIVDQWPIFPGSTSVYCLGLCGPISDLGEPFWHDPPIAEDDPRAEGPFDDLLGLFGQNSANRNAVGRQNGGVSSTVTPDSSAAETVEGQSVPKEPVAPFKLNRLGIAQKTGAATVDRNAATNDDAATSTDVLDHQTKPPVTNDGKKFEPRRLGENTGPRNGLAAAVKSGLDQIRSSLSPKKPSTADNVKTKDDESDSSGD